MLSRLASKASRDYAKDAQQSILLIFSVDEQLLQGYFPSGSRS